METNTDSPADSDRADDSDKETACRWRNARTTTVILDKEDEGEWYATQRGVDLVGHGETAVEAAAEYCQLVDNEVRS
jgi:hypothetical protein